jgi:transposase-like protein
MSKKKISSSEKIEAVEQFLRGEISQPAQARKLGINLRTFQDWIRKYQSMGTEGLLERKKNKNYPTETKQSAVEEYLSGKGSQADICKKYKITDRKMLRCWISMYNGHKELRPSRGRGSDIYMTKGRNTTHEERVEIVSYCIEHSNDYTAVIEKYGVSYQQIYSWVRKYNEKGAEGLVDKRGKRKPEAEMTELEKLRAENRMLEAQNKRLETENAVLKKLEEIEGRWR